MSTGATNDDNHPAAARRSLEEIVALASDVNVRVAVEVIPNRLSTPEALVHLIEEEYDGDLAETCRRVYPRLEGHFAFLAMARDEPDRIVAARLVEMASRFGKASALPAKKKKAVAA